MSAVPPELAELRSHMAELADLRSIGYLLFWDQNTMMPPGGSSARGHQSATLRTIAHERLTDPRLGRLLDALEPWAAAQDPDGYDARAIRVMRRDFEKAVRVPVRLAAEMSRADSTSQVAWEQARRENDFSRFRDALALQIELRHRYAACFETAHPYDALLDDFHHGLTTAELRPLLTELRDRLVPLVAAAGGPDQPRQGGAFGRPYAAEDQRAAVLHVLSGIAYEQERWRLDASPHPFSQPVARTDQRITTHYTADDLGRALYSSLHELGHALYDMQIDPVLERTVLQDGASFSVHESQSRWWENFVGRSRSFTRWLHGRLGEVLPGGMGHVDPAGLYVAVNGVRPSPIRVGSDETTYNLHIVLRVELELGLMDGTLAVDDVPAAWEEGMRRLLGVEVPDAAHGALQDIHWGSGMIGYFPSYALGNLIAAQLWRQVAIDIPDLDERLERGEFGALCEWQREHVHRHGRARDPAELLVRVTGEPLSVAPFIDYLETKLADAGLLASGAA